jgi:hypothetical protein
VNGTLDVGERLVEVVKTGFNKFKLGAGAKQNHEARIDTGHRRTRSSSCA